MVREAIGRRVREIGPTRHVYTDQIMHGCVYLAWGRDQAMGTRASRVGDGEHRWGLAGHLLLVLMISSSVCLHQVDRILLRCKSPEDNHRVSS